MRGRKKLAQQSKRLHNCAMQPALQPAPASETSHYIGDYDAVLSAMNRYDEGVRTGDSSVMKPVFHDACTFFGHFQGQLLAGPIQMLFDWVDGNGPSPDMQSRVASVDIMGTVAVVRLEVEHLSGKLAGNAARLSDAFSLIKIGDEWKISQKSFHWHAE